MKKRSTEHKRKRVAKVSDDGKIICTYNTIRDAARKNGIHENLIRKTIYGYLKKTHGFKWIFIVD